MSDVFFSVLGVNRKSRTLQPLAKILEYFRKNDLRGVAGVGVSVSFHSILINLIKW